MNHKNHVRRALVTVVLASSIATTVGATGAVRAEGDAPTDPPAAALPADDSPPGPGAGDSALPGATTPPPPEESSTTTPTAAASTAPAVPAPTDSATTASAAIPPSTTTPPAAIATTTTVAPTNALATVVAFSAATAPLSPVATPGNGTVTLTWKAPSSNGGAPVDFYAVQQLVSGMWKNIGWPTGLSYPVGGLTNGTKYYFRVVAHNAAGWSPVSTTVSATPRTVPTAPLSPVATPGNGSVALTWKAPSSNGGATIVKYAVQRLINGQWQSIAYPTTQAYNVPGLTNGTKYYFRIRAYNAAGWSPVSTTVSAVPRTVPSAPTYLTATPLNGSVALSWKPPASNGGAAIDMYMVMYATSLAGPWTTLPVQTPTNGIYGGLKNGTTYYFRVDAHNAAGWGADAQVAAVPRTVPGMVPSCNAYQPVYGSLWMTVTWQAPANGGAPIDHYLIEIWKNGHFYISYKKEAYQVQGSAQVYSGGIYEVRVSAHNASGYGAYCSQNVGVWQY